MHRDMSIYRDIELIFVSFAFLRSDHVSIYQRCEFLVQILWCILEIFLLFFLRQDISDQFRKINDCSSIFI